MSNVPSSAICGHADESPVCSSQSAGYYNASASSTSFTTAQTSFIKNGSFSGVIGALPLFGDAIWTFDHLTISSDDLATSSTTIPDFDMFVMSEAYSTLPDDTKFSIEVGNLALGAPHVNQT